MRCDPDDGSDRPDEPKQFAADGNHALMLGFSTNQEMPITLVEALLCIQGDRAGCCWNLALAFAQVTAHAGSMPVVPSRLDDNPAQMRVSGLGDTPATNVATAAVFGTEPCRRKPLTGAGSQSD